MSIRYTHYCTTEHANFTTICPPNEPTEYDSFICPFFSTILYTLDATVTAAVESSYLSTIHAAHSTT